MSSNVVCRLNSSISSSSLCASIFEKSRISLMSDEEGFTAVPDDLHELTLFL